MNDDQNDSNHLQSKGFVPTHQKKQFINPLPHRLIKCYLYMGFLYQIFYLISWRIICQFY